MVNMDTSPGPVGINLLLLGESAAVNFWRLKVKRNYSWNRCLSQSAKRETRLLAFVGKHWALSLGHLSKCHPQETLCESDHGTWIFQGRVAPAPKLFESNWGNYAMTWKLEPTCWVGNGEKLMGFHISLSHESSGWGWMCPHVCRW